MNKRSGKAGVDRCNCAPIDELLEARFFRALCDPTRIAILAQLTRCCGPRTVTDVASRCTVSVSVVSRHLAVLRDAGFLHAEKCGKEVHYTVRYPEITATLREIADAIEACCPE